MSIKHLWIGTLLCSGLLSGCAATSMAPVEQAYFVSNDFPSDGRYVVVGGDTLYNLAVRFELPIEKIAAINHILPPYRLQPGQILQLNLPPEKKVDILPTKAVAAETLEELPLWQEKEVKNSGSIAYTSKAKISAVGLGKADQDIQWQLPSTGKTISAYARQSKDYNGVDFAGKIGDPILAAADGEVVYAGSGLRGYGNLLIIKHNKNFLSTYAHNRSLSVKEGERVKSGQQIAEMGKSDTDKVHLHFEIRNKGRAVDPMTYLQGR